MPSISFDLAKLAELQVMLPEFLLQEVLSESDALLALFGLDPVPDLGHRPRGDHKLQPVLAGMVSRLGDDLDRIPVLELILQRNDVPVHLGADTLVADIRVDAVGKIDRRRPLGKGLHISVRA